ncbi:MAG: hypothetical protein ACI35P_02650 [Bacillus sp. (in: firmicutes)]
MSSNKEQVQLVLCFDYRETLFSTHSLQNGLKTFVSRGAPTMKNVSVFQQPE